MFLKERIPMRFHSTRDVKLAYTSAQAITQGLSKDDPETIMLPGNPYAGDEKIWMPDKEQIEALYREMYNAMVAKDTATLGRVHADNFVLIHMTGMRQSKAEYIRAIADGTLNYYSAEHEEMDIAIKGNTATLTGKSRVTAAVFGGSRGTWRLRLRFTLEKQDGQWRFTSSQASTY